MRTFTGFPQDSACPVCHTNEDRECIVIEIDGTINGNICEGQPLHTDCIKLRFNREIGAIYQQVEKVKT